MDLEHTAVSTGFSLLALAQHSLALVSGQEVVFALHLQSILIQKLQQRVWSSYYSAGTCLDLLLHLQYSKSLSSFEFLILLRRANPGEGQ
jgi:hypothetical protein